MAFNTDGRTLGSRWGAEGEVGWQGMMERSEVLLEVVVGPFLRVSSPEARFPHRPV